MKQTLRLVLAQRDCTVGALGANASRIAAAAAAARDQHAADLVVFPELALCGYTPEDLLLQPDFLRACDEALLKLAAECGDIDVLVGHPARAPALDPTSPGSAAEPTLANCVSLLRAGSVQSVYAKHALPDYGVFDEKRYFSPGSSTCVIDVRGVQVGVLICEDVWTDAPVAAAMAAGAELLVVVNASPFDQHKLTQRRAVLQQKARLHRVGIAYLNLVGGQDELLFDGASMLIDGDGRINAQAPAFSDALLPADYDAATRSFTAIDWPDATFDNVATVYAGLVRGVRDYIEKNGFPGVLLGLSGGIDSALTLALAVDALGAERVTAVMLPTRYTSALSLDGARAQAQALGVEYHVLPIEDAFASMLATLAPAFGGKGADLTEENLQARIRGALLMALSNKHGRLLLATGNKSEMAVGYATLYGDMCGAYAPLKDVYKTLVYRLARWRNVQDTNKDAGPVIPPAVIERPPSAELRDNQTDQDSLPDYDTLDAILERFIEDGQAPSQIVAAGFDADTVARVTALVLRNEFKRRQSAPGPKVTTRAFGRDRRYPITSGWR